MMDLCGLAVAVAAGKGGLAAVCGVPRWVWEGGAERGDEEEAAAGGHGVAGDRERDLVP